MDAPLKTLSWAALACFAFCFLLGLGEQRQGNAGLALTLSRQEAGEDDSDAPATSTYQRLRQTAAYYLSDYGFRNFNDDRLSVEYQVNRQALGPYEAAFGYRKADLAGLRDPQQISAYFESRGFRVIDKNTVSVDIPQIVRKNAPLVRSVASAIEQVALSRHYDSEEVVGAVTSMVQTAIRYQVPALMVDGRDTGGVLQPVSVLVKGYGDCDTKTGLLGSLLANWPGTRMVGIAVPGHYLMGILRIPQKRDLFIEYGGLQYVLVEPAGPAWLPPGTVSEHTTDLLDSSQGYRIDPFF